MGIANVVGKVAGFEIHCDEATRKHERLSKLTEGPFSDPSRPQMAALMRAHKMDWVQVNYSIDERSAEEEVFPLAQKQGVAVMLNVPLDGRRGSLFSRVKNTPLPAWAKDFDATSWSSEERRGPTPPCRPATGPDANALL